MLNAAPTQFNVRTSSLDLLLRESSPSDSSAIIEAIHESLPELKKFMVWSHMPQTEAVQQARLEEMTTPAWRRSNRVYHILSPNDERFLGCIGLHAGRVINPMGFEIGYWMRTSAAGRGVITAATKAIVVLGFEHLGAQRIQCGYNEANAASARVNEKVGFVQEARLRHFEPLPTEAQRADGCAMAEHLVLGALFPSDRTRLPWYEAACAALTLS